MLSMVSCYNCEGDPSDPEPESQQEQAATPPVVPPPAITLTNPRNELTSHTSFNLNVDVAAEISNTAKYVLQATKVAYSNKNYTTPQVDLTAKTNVDAMNGKTLQEALKGKPASLVANSSTKMAITIEKHATKTGKKHNKI